MFLKQLKKIESFQSERLKIQTRWTLFWWILIQLQGKSLKCFSDQNDSAKKWPKCLSEEKQLNGIRWVQLPAGHSEDLKNSTCDLSSLVLSNNGWVQRMVHVWCWEVIVISYSLSNHNWLNWLNMKCNHNQLHCQFNCN